MGAEYYYLDPVVPGTDVLRGTAAEVWRVLLALNEGKSWHELCDLLFETLPPLLPVDRIGIAMLEPDGHTLRSRYVRSRREVLLGEGEAGDIRGSSLEPIVQERKIRIISDLAAYSRRHPLSETAAMMAAEGMRASLTLPLLTRERVLGVVFFTSTEVGAYHKSHVALVCSLALEVGTAFERAELLDSLREANARLRSVDVLKSNFLNMISHELRTPLAVILGYAAVLEDELACELSKAHKEHLAQISAAGERLNRLLRDLLDFTALDAGRFELSTVPASLTELLRELAAQWQPQAGAKKLDFRLNVPDDTLDVICDPPQLARAIGALLDNAFKFTPAPGEVVLTAGRDGETVWVAVQDTGPAVPDDVRAHLFDRFYQADSSTTRCFSGMGLGLPLARVIAEAHGGTLTLDPTPVGARFALRIPVRGPSRSGEGAVTYGAVGQQNRKSMPKGTLR